MNSNSRNLQRGASLWLVMPLIAAAALGLWYLVEGREDGVLHRQVELKAAQAVGKLALKALPDATSDDSSTHGRAVDLIKRPIEVHALAENIHYASGVDNVVLISTDEGNVVFDTGLAMQAAEQLSVLKKAVPDKPVTHIIVSHSHADHVGGVRFWKEPGTKVIAHREFTEEQRYLKELEPYLYGRNRMLFPFMPEKPVNIGILSYGGVEPTDVVDESADYEFELGGVRFVVISAPGAEGADNIVLWLPEQKILFSGDFFGPQFPQFPNIFTMRGEKVRKPIEYIRSLNKLIALEPDLVLPGHFGPTSGKEVILADMVRIRDAVQYVHDQTVAGMNAGKTVYQLMQEITLPPELDLPQNHGRVSWAVKSIWEYYATWFHSDTTTELYPVPARDVYATLGELAGTEALVRKGREYLEGGKPVHTIHLMEVALAADNSNPEALHLQLDALNALLKSAKDGLRNDYEIYWLNAQIAGVESRLIKPLES